MRRPLPSYSTLIDLLDYNPETGDLVWKKWPGGRVRVGDVAGCRNLQQRYVRVSVKGLAYHAHLIAWTLHYGAPPEEFVDHINGDGFDNRIANLRSVSHSENMKNSPLRADNTTGHPGVYHGKFGRYYAQSCHGGKNKHLGTFLTLEEAIAARREFQARNGFHENHGRRPRNLRAA